MLVVVGSGHDLAARELVVQWAPDDAALLSCEDLSKAGWAHYPADRGQSRTVVAGQIVAERDIRGILVRRPCVLEEELVHIAPSDREYVAAELNAFLVSWLAHAQCPVLNRPQGTCLCGPNWRPLQWAAAAARLGIAASPRCASPATPASSGTSDDNTPAPPVEVIVVGACTFGAPSAAHSRAALDLARASGTMLLAVRFDPHRDEPRFMSATAMPRLQQPEVRGKVRDALLGATAGNRFE